MGIEPTSSAWKADILADVLYPQLQKALYHNFPQMSSMNLEAAKLCRLCGRLQAGLRLAHPIIIKGGGFPYCERPPPFAASI